jgi:hypothetical protein
MALKRAFNEDEKFGLTEEEIRLAEKYLRKHKTAGAIPDLEAIKLYELYMVGCSFQDIHAQHPQYPVPKIILTCALRGWAKDREKIMGSLRDRVQAKVVKSVIDQVDFLTTLLSVVNTEHLEVMRKYITDPVNNPPPNIRVSNIKEYKETVETLSKLVAGATGANKKNSAMFDTLSAPKGGQPLPEKEEPEELDPARLIEAEIVK